MCIRDRLTGLHYAIVTLIDCAVTHTIACMTERQKKLEAHWRRTPDTERTAIDQLVRSSLVFDPGRKLAYYLNCKAMNVRH